MAGLGGRMSTVIKAKVSKMLDRAEDPAETLDYSYQKQLESLQQVKKGIADVVTAKKRLQMQSTKLEQSVVKLDTQARQALAQGNEELARVALERKNVAQTELQGLDSQVTELEAQQERLTDSEKKLRAKIEAFRTKKEVIKAQYSAAEAQVRISEAATGVGEQMADVGLAMQRAVDKTENMKARADAVSELEAGGDVRGPHAARRRARTTSTASCTSSRARAGRRRAGEDEGRARRRAGAGAPRRRARAGAEPGRAGGSGVIVRISGEGQWKLSDGARGAVNEKDNAAVAAVVGRRRGGFRSALAICSRPCASRATSWPTTTSSTSDVILPPADTSLAEAGGGVHGRGPDPGLSRASVRRRARRWRGTVPPIRTTLNGAPAGRRR